MTTWKPPHKTAQQRRAARTPTQRKVDTAALAPSVSLPPNRCECGHMAMAHRTVWDLADESGRAHIGQCDMPGCDCTDFAREST